MPRPEEITDRPEPVTAHSAVSAMKYRNPIAVFFLSIFTFGIYPVVWCFKTRRELYNSGYDIPTAWLLFIPFVNLYWLWRYAEAVEEATDGANTKIVYFILMLPFIQAVGHAIIQHEFNRAPQLPPGDITITVERIGP
jgi:hypothetical protein